MEEVDPIAEPTLPTHVPGPAEEDAPPDKQDQGGGGKGDDDLTNRQKFEQRMAARAKAKAARAKAKQQSAQRKQQKAAERRAARAEKYPDAAGFGTRQQVAEEAQKKMLETRQESPRKNEQASPTHQPDATEQQMEVARNINEMFNYDTTTGLVMDTLA